MEAGEEAEGNLGLADLLAELRAMREEVEQLRGEQRRREEMEQLRGQSAAAPAPLPSPQFLNAEPAEAVVAALVKSQRQGLALSKVQTPLLDSVDGIAVSTFMVEYQDMLQIFASHGVDEENAPTIFQCINPSTVPRLHFRLADAIEKTGHTGLSSMSNGEISLLFSGRVHQKRQAGE
jgi:hypothetical protein